MEIEDELRVKRSCLTPPRLAFRFIFSKSSILKFSGQTNSPPLEDIGVNDDAREGTLNGLNRDANNS